VKLWNYLDTILATRTDSAGITIAMVKSLWLLTRATESCYLHGGGLAMKVGEELDRWNLVDGFILDHDEDTLNDLLDFPVVIPLPSI
jgi:hypothetical protein